MSTIVPRWEWRTFGERFGAAEDALRRARARAASMRATSCTSLSAADVEDTVKVRAELMDVKRLERGERTTGSSSGGPSLKAAVPARPDGRRRPCSRRCDAAAPRLASRRVRSTSSSTRSSARAPSCVDRSQVHKRRAHYRSTAAWPSSTEVRGRRRARRARSRVEAEDPGAGASRPSEALGLWTRANVELPARAQGARRVRRARGSRSIDVGTNSVKFHVAERGRGRRPGDARRPRRGDAARRGPGRRRAGSQPGADGAHDRRDRAHGRTRRGALGAERDRRGRHRRAADRAERGRARIEAVSRCGTDVVSRSSRGDEESPARVPRRRALGIERVDRRSLVVFDTGGGSTQFTFGHDGARRRAVQRQRRRGALHRALRPRRRRRERRARARRSTRSPRSSPGSTAGRRPTRSSAMGGAVTNLAAVKHGLATYDPDVVQGTVLDLGRDRSPDRALPHPRPPRSGGRSSACSRSAPRSSSPAPASSGRCWTKLGRESLTVSDRGLRHGLLVERFGP